MSSLPASFRDPSGVVVSHDGRIYRCISEEGASGYESARESGILEKLVNKGLLLPYEEVQDAGFAPEGTVHCLSHPTLPMVSYPWEWPFSMLRDAALLHLEIMDDILPRGFWLRDASAFNIQFDGSRLRLIDTLSIGPREQGAPWVGYRQFCSHFIAPLAVAAHKDIRLLLLWCRYLDGFPLDLAARILGAAGRLRPRLFMHLTLHARFQKSREEPRTFRRRSAPKKPRMSDRALTGLVNSLRKTVDGTRWKHERSFWKRYADIRNYGEDDVARKKNFVSRVVGELRPEKVWDLGANTGEFSVIAASAGSFVVSIDGDPDCTELLYRQVASGALRGVLPLTVDLSNPSPALGWDHAERQSLRERGPADLLLVLALIHHFVLGNGVPLRRVAAWLASLGQRAIVEFVPPDDPMVRRMRENVGGQHHPYSMDAFEESFYHYFDLSCREALANGRTMFLLEKKA